jgi:hypothetical protein
MTVQIVQANGAQVLSEERPFSELSEGLIGVIDSREPYERPQKERDTFGKGVIAKLEKQGIKLSSTSPSLAHCTQHSEVG